MTDTKIFNDRQRGSEKNLFTPRCVMCLTNPPLPCAHARCSGSSAPSAHPTWL